MVVLDVALIPYLLVSICGQNQHFGKVSYWQSHVAKIKISSVSLT
jgi:hypothetical protein